MPQPGGMPSVMPPYYPPTSGFPSYPSYPPHAGASMYPSQGYPAYPMPYGPQPPVAGASGTGTTGTITDEHIRASLMSAIEDKLKRRMKDQFSQHQAELETLRRTHQELVQGKSKLDDILSRLDRDQVSFTQDLKLKFDLCFLCDILFQNELDKNIKILQDKEQELDKSIARLANEESIDVDNAVTTTAPLYKQYVQ